MKVGNEPQQRPAPGARDAATVRTLEPLTRYGWTLLHDLDRPGRVPAGIDHVAVGPGGVAVIAAAPRRTTAKELLLPADDVEGVSLAAAEITARLAPHHRSAVSAIVRVPTQSRGPATMVHGVRLVGPHLLVPHLLSLPERLEAGEVDEIAAQLHDQLAGPTTLVSARRLPRHRPSVVRELIRFVTVVAATWGVVTYVLP